MNKQAKTPKTSRGVYIKFTLIMIASALTGALISIFLLGREDGLMQLAQQAGDCLTQAGPWLMALGLAPCAAAHGLYLAGKKAAARAGEDDEAFEAANRRLSLSMVFSAVAMPWVMLTSCLAVPAVTLWESAIPALAVVPLMIAELAWSYGLQAAVVRLPHLHRHEQNLPLRHAGGAAGGDVRRRQRAVGSDAGRAVAHPDPDLPFAGPCAG